MKARTIEEERDRVKQRVHVKVDEEKHEYYPETEHNETYDNDAYQRVGVYVRVSTDEIHQSLSYELQKTYYEDFVIRHPKWKLVDIYADEGISGTSLKHRDEFNRMIADAKAGKIDLIITQKVSNVSKNPQELSFCARMLASLPHPVGIYFVSEDIFTLATYYMDDLRDYEFLPDYEMSGNIEDQSNGGLLNG